MVNTPPELAGQLLFYLLYIVGPVGWIVLRLAVFAYRRKPKKERSGDNRTLA